MVLRESLAQDRQMNSLFLRIPHRCSYLWGGFIYRWRGIKNNLDTTLIYIFDLLYPTPPAPPPLLNPNPAEIVSGLYTKGAFWTWICTDGLAKPCNGALWRLRNLLVVGR